MGEARVLRGDGWEFCGDERFCKGDEFMFNCDGLVRSGDGRGGVEKQVGWLPGLCMMIGLTDLTNCTLLRVVFTGPFWRGVKAAALRDVLSLPLALPSRLDDPAARRLTRAAPPGEPRLLKEEEASLREVSVSLEPSLRSDPSLMLIREPPGDACWEPGTPGMWMVLGM